MIGYLFEIITKGRLSNICFEFMNWFELKYQLWYALL